MAIPELRIVTAQSYDLPPSTQAPEQLPRAILARDLTEFPITYGITAGVVVLFTALKGVDAIKTATSFIQNLRQQKDKSNIIHFRKSLLG